VRKHEEWTKEEVEHYVKVMKEHEARRASFNERMEYWNNYNKRKDLDPETSFDMGRFT
jgi:hypothetical protein